MGQPSTTAQTITLNPKPFQLSQTFAREELERISALDNGTFHFQAEWAQWIRQQLEVRLSGDILSRPVRSLVFTWPLDWWEAVKQRFAPEWFLRRWPVLSATRRVEVFDLYPECNIVLPPDRYGRPHRLVYVDGVRQVDKTPLGLINR